MEVGCLICQEIYILEFSCLLIKNDILLFLFHILIQRMYFYKYSSYVTHYSTEGVLKHWSTAVIMLTSCNTCSCSIPFSDVIWTFFKIILSSGDNLVIFLKIFVVD